MRPRIAKPAPFKRDGISIEHHNKAWQRIVPLYLDVGDIVAGHGAIEYIWFSDASDQAHIKFVSGESGRFPCDEELFAFTEKHG